MAGELHDIPLSAIESNRYQPRSHFEQEEIENLAQSIREIGLLQPPVVRKKGEHTFELIAGERRVLACRLLQLQTIRALVVPMSHKHSMEAALIENIQRVDLNPIEVAQAIVQLAQEFHLTQEEIAQKIGKKRSTVANFIRLLKLPEKMQESLKKNEITMAHAKTLLGCRNDTTRMKLFEKMKKEAFTIRKSDEWLQRKKHIKQPIDIYLRDMQKKLEHKFKTKIEIVDKKIIFYYTDNEDISRLYEELLSNEV